MALAPLLIFLISLFSAPQTQTGKFLPASDGFLTEAFSSEDTTVNYCKLVRAGYFYGQKFADKRAGLTQDDVEYFNNLWDEVFNIPSYQTGITINEFVIGARFGEGNLAPFPPS